MTKRSRTRTPTRTLRELRHERGLTQRQVDDLAGFSPGATSRYERGAGMRVRTLARLLDALGARLEVHVRVGKRTYKLC